MLQSHANWQHCHHKLTKQAAVGKLQNNLRDKKRQNNPRENRLAGVTQPLKRRRTEPNPTGSPLPAFFTIFLPPAAMLTTSCGKRTHFAFHPDKAGGGGGQNHQLDYLVLSNVSRHFTACSKPCAGGSSSSSTEHLTSVKLNCFAIFSPLLLHSTNAISIFSTLIYNCGVSFLCSISQIRQNQYACSNTVLLNHMQQGMNWQCKSSTEGWYDVEW